MSNLPEATAPLDTPVPPDDPTRQLTITRPASDATVPRVGIVGDTYTILISGEQTAGRFCLIEMRVPPGGGPAPHRHDFEETFVVVEGAITFTFRDEPQVIGSGETVNIPSNAPHSFRNESDRPARMYCICSPAGQDAFFLQIGQPLEPGEEGRPLNDDEQRAFVEHAMALAPQYRTELLGP